MYKLYGFNGAASLAPHLILEEAGAAYDFIRLDNAKGEHKGPEYLKLNPYGRVPTLVVDGVAIFESAAICAHLADAHPNLGLLPKVGDAHRAQAYQWLMFLTNSIQPAMMAFFYPDRLADGETAQANVKLKAEQGVQHYWQSVEEHLAKNGPFLLGQNLSVADYFLMMLVRWGRWFKEPVYGKYPAIKQLVDHLSARPAVQKAFEQEGIVAPYCLNVV